MMSSVHPFKHELNLTTWDYVTSVVCGIVLVPVRILLIAVVVFISWLGAVIFTSEPFRKPEGIPNTKQLLKTYEFLLKLLAWSCGFVVTVKGQEVTKEECPIFVACPHSSFYDSIIVPYLHIPITISREENKEIPMLGKVLILGQSIFLKREDSASKRMAAQSLDQWLEATSRAGSPAKTDQKLLLFPEGFNTNRKALLPFKTGAFRSGRPVQPVLVRYPNRLNIPIWTWEQSHGAIAIILLTLSRPYTRIEIEILPPYQPNEEEKHDAKLYAENVRQLMSKAIDIPASSMTSDEVYALRQHIIDSRKIKKEKNL